MKTIELEKASRSLRMTVRLAARGILVLTRNGKPVCALVGVNDELALEALLLGRNARFMAYLDRISERAQGMRRHTSAEVREELLASPPRPRRRKPARRRRRRG
jgi:hypothetical protein